MFSAIRRNMLLNRNGRAVRHGSLFRFILVELTNLTGALAPREIPGTFLMKKKTCIYLLALLPFVLLTMMYLILPLFMVIASSFRSDTTNALTLANYKTVFSKLLYTKAITNSIRISLMSAIIGMIIAFLGARAARDCKGRLGTVFTTILNMVSNFAGIPLAFAYMILLGNAGVMVQFGRAFGIHALANFNLYSRNGMSLIYVYFQVPLATLLLLPAFDGIRKEWQEAASLLGSRPSAFWMKVGIPVLMPSILSTFSVLFANALAAYATAYALMMNSLSLLPIQIAGCFVGEVKIQKGLGGALSCVMMAIMVVMILITNGISKPFRKGVRT